MSGPTQYKGYLIPNIHTQLWYLLCAVPVGPGVTPCRYQPLNVCTRRTRNSSEVIKEKKNYDKSLSTDRKGPGPALCESSTLRYSQPDNSEAKGRTSRPPLTILYCVLHLSWPPDSYYGDRS
jgi:hypothetical protein